MRRFAKSWGETQPIFQRGNAELHRIRVTPGGYCSKHLHQSKWNGFIVESGCLKVTVWKHSGTVDVTTLRSGDFMEVAPGEQHRFHHDEPGYGETVAYEMYWTELDPSDIDREDTGGLNSPES